MIESLEEVVGMRRSLSFFAILVLVIFTACSKPEPAIEQTEGSAPPVEAATQATVETAPEAPPTGATQPPTGTVIPPPAATQPVPAPTPHPTTKAPATAASAPAASSSTPAVEVPATKPAAVPVETPVAAQATPPPAAAGAEKPPQVNPKAPKSHTVNQGGVLHAAGAESPTPKCAGCHGKDLKGGKMAPVSCFKCHEKTWK